MEESGWLNVMKPAGCASTRIVSLVKGITGAKKVGHGGTLDPLAEGVLPICINKATKEVERMINHEKQYLFHLTFGESRTTCDAEGEVVERSDVIPSETDIKNILPKFIGEIEQIPPIFSALKVNGRRAYEMARKGQKIELSARKILVSGLLCVGFVGERTAEFIADCGRGCYIRSLGADLAKALGTVGYVSKIIRRRIGNFFIENSIIADRQTTIDFIRNNLISL
jgi:tRNA pseudouridine55 synthase